MIAVVEPIRNADAVPPACTVAMRKRGTDESFYFGSLLILLGLLAFYGGRPWLVWIIPGAFFILLISGMRSRARRAAIDDRVDNRTVIAVGK